MSVRIWLSLALSVSWSSSAHAKPERILGTESSIPDVRYRPMIDFRADGNEGVWIQDVWRQWHYAKFAQPCPDLAAAVALATITGTSDALDRTGGIVPIRKNDDLAAAVQKFGANSIRSEKICPFTSFVASDRPRKKSKAKKSP